MYKEQKKLLLETGGLDLNIIKIIESKLKEGRSIKIDKHLEVFIQALNLTYRSGAELVPDDDYDNFYLPLLKQYKPNSTLLLDIETETLTGKTVPLPKPMLSTDKAYTEEEIIDWYIRGKNLAEDIGVTDLSVKVTAKLDGWAAYNDKWNLITRGNGKRGTDISHVLMRGLTTKGTKPGPGEIVIDTAYFKKYLSKEFSNSRNAIASIIKPGVHNQLIDSAIKNGGAKIILFNNLPHEIYPDLDSLMNKFNHTIRTIRLTVPYDTDGAVLEFIDPKLKKAIGDTRKHHRWQIAFKENSEKVVVSIKEMICQVSRTGRLNPVASFDPVKLCDVMVSKATAHNYGIVKSKKIGIGSSILLTRSGDVIPTILKVTSKSKINSIPKKCPCCKSKIIWEGDFLMCKNKECPDQVKNRMTFFFSNLNICDGFGPVTISVLYDNGIRNLLDIYKMENKDFIKCGFGKKESANLIYALLLSISLPIDDWQWLASFGISGLGNSNSENLLLTTDIKTLLTMNASILMGTEGIGPKSSKGIVEGLKENKNLILDLLDLGFNLISSKRILNGDLIGKVFVITGSFNSSRKEVIKHLKERGAKVNNTVSKNTTTILMGENPGNSKITKAKKLSIPMVDSTLLNMG